MAITSASLLTRLQAIGKQSVLPAQADILEALIQAQTPAAFQALINAYKVDNRLNFPPADLLGDDFALPDADEFKSLQAAALEARISMGLSKAVIERKFDILQSVLRANSLAACLKTLRDNPTYFGNLSEEVSPLFTKEMAFRLQSIIAMQFKRFANTFFQGLFAGAPQDVVPLIEPRKLIRALTIVKDLKSFTDMLPADSAEKADADALLLEVTTELDRVSERARAKVRTQEPIKTAITTAYDAIKQIKESDGPISSTVSHQVEEKVGLMEELIKGLPPEGDEHGAANAQWEEAKIWSRQVRVRAIVSMAASFLEKFQTKYLVDSEHISDLTAEQATQASSLAETALSHFGTLPEVTAANGLLAKASQLKDAAFPEPDREAITHSVAGLLAEIPRLKSTLETHRDTLSLRAAIANVEAALEAVPGITADNEGLVLAQQHAVVDALPAMQDAVNTLTDTGNSLEDETPAGTQLAAANTLLTRDDSQAAIQASAKAKCAALLALIRAYDPSIVPPEPDAQFAAIDGDFHALKPVFDLAVPAGVDTEILGDEALVSRAYYSLSIAKLVNFAKTSVEHINLPATNLSGSASAGQSITDAEAVIARAEESLGAKLTEAKDAMHQFFGDDEEGVFNDATTDDMLGVTAARDAITEARRNLLAYQTRVPAPPAAAASHQSTPALSTLSPRSFRAKPLFMETKGELSDFTTKIINQRAPLPAPVASAPVPVLPKPRSELTAGTGIPIRIEKRVLQSDEVIQSEAQFQVNDRNPALAKVLLEQDSSGKVSNKTKTEEYARLEDEQKEMVALRQAQMLVMNLDKTKPGKVSIRCSDFAEAQRLYAALLALGVEDKNIRCMSTTLSRTSLFHWSGSVIKENLGHVLAVAKEMKKNLEAAKTEINTSGSDTAWEKQDEDDHYTPTP